MDQGGTLVWKLGRHELCLGDDFGFALGIDWGHSSDLGLDLEIDLDRSSDLALGLDLHHEDTLDLEYILDFDLEMGQSLDLGEEIEV